MSMLSVPTNLVQHNNWIPEEGELSVINKVKSRDSSVGKATRLRAG
jgi:hypothetical protein